MVPGLFGDQTSRLLRTALGGLHLRQQTIANNIANVDTPHYRTKSVEFEQALAAELAAPQRRGPQVVRLHLAATHEQHIPVEPVVRRFEARPALTESLDGTLRNDGNTVDVEREMTLLAETQLLYNALAQVTSHKMAMLRNAVNEGRR